MAIRIDPDIPLGHASPTPGELTDPESPLVLAGIAGPGDYCVEGSRVVIRGGERKGGASVRIDGRAVLAELEADVGMAANLLASPAMVSRERIGRGGIVLERVLALPTLPMAVFQWTGSTALDLTFVAFPNEEDLRYRVAEGAFRAEPAGVPLGVEVRIHPRPSGWTVTEAPEGGLRVRAEVAAASGPVTLLVARGDRTGAARTLEAALHLKAHALRAEAEPDPSEPAGLRTGTGVAELDQGTAWASVRLAGALLRGEPTRADGWLWSGLGALASGDAAGAETAARALMGTPRVPTMGTAAPGPALAALLLARATLLSGDASPARRAADWCTPEALEEVRAEATPDEWAWWSWALGEMADALRHAADDGEIQALRTAAALSPSSPQRRLPMAGAAPLPGSAPWLRSLLRGAGLPPAASAGEADPLVRAWEQLAWGDADGGWARWRTALGTGLAGGGAVRGSWEPPGGGAGILLSTLAFGVMGAAPDAPSGRMRLAPALPSHLTRFAVRGLRVGRTLMELSYHREGPVHRFHLEPLSGGVPPMMVLEPSVACRSASGFAVDGVPADLAHESEGERTRVRVQVALDGPRTLEIREG